MNSIPIVTVGDLATNSFTANKKGIDLKLSKATGNGLKQTADGLFYSGGEATSRSPRILLGAFTRGTSKTFNFNNELDVTIGVQDLQSDGIYLYFSLGSSFDLQLSRYNHQNATTYNGETGETEYGRQFENRFWNDMSNQYNVNYSVGGVIRQLMLSQVRLGNVFYVWCDIICVEPVGFIEGAGGGDITGITYAGKHYDEFYLTGTYGLNLVMVEGYDEVARGYDSYLTRFGPEGLVEPIYSFLFTNGVSALTKYNYSLNTLAIVHDTGDTLRVLVNGLDHVLTIQTGRSNKNVTIEIYPDSASDDILIAVAHGSDNVVDIYRVDTTAYTLVKDSSIVVDFATLTANTNYYHIMALKVLSTNHVGLVLFLAKSGNTYEHKALVVNTTTNSVVVDQAITDSNTYSGIENQKWFIDGDQNGLVKVYEFSETGITAILEHQLDTDMYPTTVKCPIKESVELVDRMPGCVYYDWGGLDMAVLTVYSNAGVPTIDVVNVRLNEPLDDSDKIIGYGELMLGSDPFIAAIDKRLKPLSHPITIVQ